MRRALRLAFALATAGVLVGCTASVEAGPTPSPTPTPTFLADDATFAVADEPIQLDTEFRVSGGDAVVVAGDRVLVGGPTGPVSAFDAATGASVWRVESFSGDQGPWIDGGSTRGVSLITSSAAGGVLLVPYTESCGWEEGACANADAETNEIAGVAAVSIADRSVVWKSPLDVARDVTSVAAEPDVVDADATGVLVTLEAPLSDEVTTVMLDAATGRELWRSPGFAGTALTDSTVYTFAQDPHDPGAPSTARTRADGTVAATFEDGVRPVDHAGPGLVLSDSDATITRGTFPDIFPLHLRGDRGEVVPSGYETQNLAQTECPGRSEGYFACSVMARSTDTVLVTWRSGEAAPTTSPSPIADHAQLWGTSGDVLLLNRNGYIDASDPAEAPPSWMAVDRDGAQVGAERPGTAIGGSERLVVTKELRYENDKPKQGDRPVAVVLKIWPVTDHPG